MNKDIVAKFKNFSFQASRPQTMQRDDLASTLYKKYAGFGLRFCTIPFEGNQRAWYIDSDFAKKLYQYLLDSISTQEGLAKRMNEYHQLEVSIFDYIKALPKGDYSKSEIVELLKKKDSIFMNQFADFAWLPYPIDTILDKQFHEKLKNEQPQEADEIYAVVTSPIKLNVYHDIRLALCQGVIDNSDSNQLSEELAAKYGWYSEYSFIEPPLTAQYFLDELSKINIDKARGEIEKIHEIEHEAPARLEGALKRIKNSETRFTAKVVQTFVDLRTARIDLIKQFQFATRVLYEQILKHLDADSGKSWSYREVVQMLDHEYYDFLEKDIIPNREEVNKRFGDYVFYHDSQTTELIYDKELISEIIKEMKGIGEQTIIKGRIAHPGIVQGFACMVYSKGDLIKVDETCILVARTTMVDYMPAMMKAKAFVTSEGGVTSHAAIVARELKKPCIVGTGNCMDVIKDGDLIEVDADHGTVKVIKQ